MPPCGICPKVPKDAPVKNWQHAIEPTERTWKVYRHYLSCQATGYSEAERIDPLVRLHARVIRQAEKAGEYNQLLAKLDRICNLLAFAGGRR